MLAAAYTICADRREINIKRRCYHNHPFRDGLIIRVICVTLDPADTRQIVSRKNTNIHSVKPFLPR